MKNLTLRVRLGSAFVVMVLLMLGISVVSVTRLNDQNQTTRTITDTVYPNAEVAQETAYRVMDTARIIRNLILLTDADAMASNKAAVDKNIAQVNKDLGRMEGMIDSDEERKAFDKVKAARAPYLDYSQDVIRLALAGKKEEATEMLFGEKYKTQAAFLTALREMIKQEEALMAKAKDHANEVYREALWITFGITAIVAAIAAVLAYAITASITRPMARAVALTGIVAGGDLSRHITVDSRDETGQLMQGLKDMNDSLKRIVSQVRDGTETIATASGEIASGNLDLSARTEEQAGALMETTSTMEELTSTVKKNAENARQASRLSVSASEIAEQGGAVVGQVIDTMSAINTSSQKIVDIISVIDGIAFQTNILALNAAVEAARAGEQGRGFAVVASEVRNLAQRSATAAREVKALIDESVANVDAGSKLVEQAGETMNDVVASVKKVTEVVSEISIASEEQSAGIEQINQTVIQMDQTTQQNAALVEQASAAARSLQEQAEKLSQVVGVFNLGNQQAPMDRPQQAKLLAWERSA